MLLLELVLVLLVESVELVDELLSVDGGGGGGGGPCMAVLLPVLLVLLLSLLLLVELLESADWPCSSMLCMAEDIIWNIDAKSVLLDEVLLLLSVLLELSVALALLEVEKEVSVLPDELVPLEETFENQSIFGIYCEPETLLTMVCSWG